VRIWNASSGDCERILKGHSGQVNALSVLPDGRIVSGSDDQTVRIWNASSGDCERILEGHTFGVREVRALSDSRLLSKDWYDNCLLWLPVEGGGGEFRSESVSKEEYDRLLWEEGVASVDGSRGGAVLGRVAAGYSVSPQNCVQSESFGRVFVDEEVQWVVRAGDDVIAVFDVTGRDHWLREVSDGS
jgi:WD40 repeat protein